MEVRRRGLGLVLMATLALQPVVFALCEANCLPRTLAVGTGAAANASAVGCHDHGSVTRTTASTDAQVLRAVHGCVHQSVPSLRPVTEKVERSVSPMITADIGGPRAAAHSRPISSRTNHAPPGGSPRPTDNLRL